MLDRDSAVPLYQQLAELLRSDIEEGRLPAGVAFPSERKLMARYRVTRTTVRSAIGVLKQEGMVAPEHGAGSFVRDPKAARRRLDGRQVGLSRPPELADAEPNGSVRAGTYGLQGPVESLVRRMTVTPWIAELLQVQEGTEVLVQEGAGVDGPALHRTWLHPRVEGELRVTDTHLTGHWLPDLLAARGIPATDGEDMVEAAMPTPGMKHLLALADGVPVLHLYRVMRERGQVVAVMETHLPADRATLVFPRSQ